MLRLSRLTRRFFAEVAQLVEQWTENPCVPSSSLGLGTWRKLCDWRFACFAVLRRVRPGISICRERTLQVAIRLEMGDRLRAGQRSLEPSIGVRIPVPQPS